MGVAATVDRDIGTVSRSALFITVGKVIEVLPARWTTPDGSRPASPCAPTNVDTIWTPVVIEIEQMVKGQQLPAHVTIIALGGQVGADSVEYGDILGETYKFQPGERVVAFLGEQGGFVLSPDAALPLGIIERYTIRPDGQPTNNIRTLPLPQLLTEIRAAISAPAN
jgi:hypothetical protein